ncbi:hypothetical protein NC653_028134 [Populus alba x Populus x berolinensis]|uniref:Uncharacterized protein n=1 Tax=Populus alba x Populus x berolinensis TaxID=444605 RepID=A0AAD6M835_9ROSI|nr:hypothetical protein NC653_028134 [Populus alba x Populus x berolinensis]
MLEKFHLLLKDGWTPKAVLPFQRMLGNDGCMQVTKVVVIGIHRLKGGRFISPKMVRSCQDSGGFRRSKKKTNTKGKGSQSQKKTNAKRKRG